MQPTSQTSRADLLRWMRRCHTPADKQLAAEILGYEWLEPQANVNLKITVGIGDQGDLKPESPDNESLNPPSDEAEEPAAITRPPEAFYALKHREQYADPDQPDDDLPECLQGIEPLSAADLRPLEQGEPLAHQPLVPQQRLLPFLRQALTYPLGQRLDVPRLVKQIARLQALQRIPRRPHVLPAGRVYVLLDLNKRLLPFWQDAHDLCDLLARQHGKNGLDIRVLEDQPSGRYYDWFDQQQAVKAWQPLKVPSVVLIVSDMGQLSTQGSVVCQGWLRFAQQLARQGIRPLVLSPVSPAQQYAPFTALVDQIPWGRLSRFKPQKPNQQQQEYASHVQRVLGLLSVAVHVEPELLRAILECLPAIQADSGVEATVYLHPDVVWGYTAMTLRAEKRAAYQALFRQEPASLQRQVLAVIRQHHIGQFPAVWAETVLNAKPLTAFTLDDAAWAEQFMVRFTRSFAGLSGHEGMAQFARRHLLRLGKDQDGNALYKDSYSSALYALAYREHLYEEADIPQVYNAGIVSSVIRQRINPIEYRVMQRGEYLFLEAVTDWSEEFPLRTGSLIAYFTTWQDMLRLRLDGRELMIPACNRLSICNLQTVQEILLDTGNELLMIGSILKPNWAHEIVRKTLGLEVVMYFLGEQYYFYLKSEEGNFRRGCTSEQWMPLKIAIDSNSSPTVLIIDSEPDIRELLEITLLRMGLDTITAGDVQTALNKIERYRPSLCLTDMKLPDGNGIEIIRYLRKNYPHIPIAGFTTFLSRDAAEEALNAGAYDLVSKPVDLPKLRELIQTALKLSASKNLYPLKEENSQCGVDQYGLYVDFPIGGIPQRFCWIEPGTFLMGSPESEPEREWGGQLKGLETQHQVTLTHGFWLADSTVTQAQWQAVMGNNSSRFNENLNNPIVRVSWNDAQIFIRKLNQQIPGLQARLPTEAQWEYACRAGTNTPFSFGDNIIPEQVNYNGDYPYNDALKGLYRGRNVPVKSLPANPWGLYEMHGNVWEWCQDVWQEKLPTELIIDPLSVAVGDQASDVLRVVRGGSWNSHSRHVRSAFRFRGESDSHSNSIGFRLALGFDFGQAAPRRAAQLQNSKSGWRGHEQAQAGRSTKPRQL